ncbi:protein kinase [Candidatus Albibeggiatoa sp. nov. NOAA]|uniref:protein kinase domain-containing protein n=1 Tax=Candidatus Albibeggiatoa sp. nov. NOAA TaxID=3162724 RepID=UPI0032F45A4D|nr:protein kinase [Thiotrichaceae bacterium]
MKKLLGDSVNYIFPIRFWEYDSVLIVCMAAILLIMSHWLQPFEQWFLQQHINQLAKPAYPELVIVTVDEKTQTTLQEYPINRQHYAEFIKQISSYAKVIGLHIDLSRPQPNPVQAQIDALVTYYQQSKLPALPEHLKQLQQIIADSQHIRARLATDQAILFQLQQFYQNSFEPDKTLTEFIQLHDRLASLSYDLSHDARLSEVLAQSDNVILGQTVDKPLLNIFGEYNHMVADIDKPSRFAAAILQKIDYSQVLPHYLIPISHTNLRIESFADALQQDPKNYQNKIVLIGDVTGIQREHLLDTASILNSVLNQQYLQHHQLANYIEMVLFFASFLYLLAVQPCLKRRWSITVLWIVALWMIYVGLFYYGWHTHFMLPVLLVVSSYIVLSLKYLIENYQDAVRLHPEAVESNRLLGLAFQGQGHLDLAFEKFRLCPPDETMLGLLYNLALDYEIKPQARRAIAVYRYILTHQLDFRDVQQRLDRLQRFSLPKLPLHQLSQTTLDNSAQKPSIGRYQIERQLGKGAMGVVYLGQDTKLDRLVAIKTLPLFEEFDNDDLQEAVIRFFREANAAGRLQHDDIIRIFDAGGEQDLAYIAMEFFKGGNLIPYSRKENLLSINIVLDIISRIALALDYAHRHQVVHRDIKPANIMYNPATNQIKITDFGIARITDTHKTKTGIILGTPSYMSPEQLAGKKIDGRTDLFSLGIMLYQLLTGKLPFKADSMASLMFKIANESHPDITQIRADIPIHLKHIIDTALAKNPQARFQTGMQFAQALRDCSDEAEYAPRNELSF